jgi:hypothetical protein
MFGLDTTFSKRDVEILVLAIAGGQSAVGAVPGYRISMG